MPNITLGIAVTRTLLSLGDLNLNDHVDFYLAGNYTPAAVTWVRNSVSAAHVDDDFTVSRRRGKVQEQLVFEVLGADQAEINTNLAAAIAAFKQDHYTFSMTFDGQTYSWAAESADYQVIWSGPRMISKQVQLAITMPRSPLPVAGAF